MLRVIHTTEEEIRRRSPLRAADDQPLAFGDGFYDEELDGIDPFRWMGLRSTLRCESPAAAGRFAELIVFSQFFDLSQELTVTAGDRPATLPLLQGWSAISVPVDHGTESLDLEVNKIFPPAYYPGDRRQLAIRVRWPRLHGDRQRHESVSRQHHNAVLNAREILDGAPLLRSTPPQLGIDMYGECNVKPACVYCAWDESKAEEGANVDTPFTRETLAEWGEFFDNSRNLVNCSIGEPFMMKNFDELLDIFGDRGKTVEITTNGQILTDRNIERLLHRDIELYISLDAATPETYAKLRNRHFEPILDNLRRLIAAKGGPGRLPKISLVFMPMQVNVHELDDFVALCAELRVDRMILRPLNWMETSDLNWDRGGYRFNYLEELLPFEELVRVSGRAAELATAYGLELSDQLDFGGTTLESKFEESYNQGRRQARAASAAAPDVPVDHAGSPFSEAPRNEADSDPFEPEREADASASQTAGHDAAAPPSLGEELLPICTEPWKSLYILRRGTLPCCHGSPLAEMQQYRETWNSPVLQDIRATLAAGRFPTYCLAATSCPIVRKAAEADEVSSTARIFLGARGLLHRVDNACGGVFGRLLKPLSRRLKSYRSV